MLNVWSVCRRLEKVFLYSFPSEAQKKGYRDILARGKYEEDKEGVELKQDLPIPAGPFKSCCAWRLSAGCYIAQRARSLQLCLSKHIQSGPVFDPLLTFSPDVFSFELDVWSIESVVKGWQHRDHQS